MRKKLEIQFDHLTEDELHILWLDIRGNRKLVDRYIDDDNRYFILTNVKSKDIETGFEKIYLPNIEEIKIELNSLPYGIKKNLIQQI